jgi:hypothetical protein
MKPFRYFYALFLLLLLAVPAAAQEIKPLPQSFASGDERLTLRYPRGWVVDAENGGFAVVASDESLFDLSDEPVPPGEAAVALMFVAEDDVLRELLQGDTPEAILETVIRTLQSPDGPKVGEPYSLSFNDLPAARADGELNGNQIFFLVVKRNDGMYQVVIAVSAEGEMAKFEPKLLAIAASANYLPGD